MAFISVPKVPDMGVVTDVLGNVADAATDATKSYYRIWLGDLLGGGGGKKKGKKGKRWFHQAKGGVGRRAEESFDDDALKQQFLEMFLGAAPGLPDRGAFLAPYDAAAGRLQAQYDANRAAIQASLPELEAKLAAIQANQHQLGQVTAGQLAQSQQTQMQAAQAQNQQLQDRMAALGVSAAPIQAQAGVQQQQAAQAQANRDAFVQRQALVQQQSDANRSSSAATANQSALAALDASRMRAQAGIDQGRAQAELAFNQASNASNREQYERKLQAVDALSNFESATSPLAFLRGEVMGARDFAKAQQTIEEIENGEYSIEEALDTLEDISAAAKESGAKVGYSPQAVSRALRKAYLAARRQREKVLAQLQAQELVF